MSNTMKRVLSFVLALVMVFSVSSLTVFAASNAEFGTAAAGSTATQPESGNSTGKGDSAATGGSFSTNWIEVVYDENNIIVTLNPTKEGLLSMSVSDIKALLSVLVEAVKKVAIEDLTDGLRTEKPVTLASYDSNMWYEALNKFLDSEYEGYENRDDQYMAFLKDVVGNENKVGEFADYACNIFRVAVQLGEIDREDLSTPETAEKQINSILTNFLDSYIEDYAKIPEVAKTIADRKSVV